MKLNHLDEVSSLAYTLCCYECGPDFDKLFDKDLKNDINAFLGKFSESGKVKLSHSHLHNRSLFRYLTEFNITICGKMLQWVLHASIILPHVAKYGNGSSMQRYSFVKYYHMRQNVPNSSSL